LPKSGPLTSLKKSVSPNPQNLPETPTTLPEMEPEPIDEIQLKNQQPSVKSIAPLQVYSRKRVPISVRMQIYESEPGNDPTERDSLRKCLAKEFEIKELGKLKCLSIEVAYSKHGIFLSQRKYVLDFLKKTGTLGCKAASTPIEPNHKMVGDQDDTTVEKRRYQRLVGKLIHLSHTRPDIAYAARGLSETEGVSRQGVIEMSEAGRPWWSLATVAGSEDHFYVSERERREKIRF
ncbi:UNVERIFIED_CONTAM: hypothetical protein Slati_1941100, partial [Sesamum latifolium]